MPTNPDQAPGTHGPQAPSNSSWFSDPDSEDIQVFRPSGLSHLPHSAPTETGPLHPPELLRQPRYTPDATAAPPRPASASSPLSETLEAPVLEYVPSLQLRVLLPAPSTLSPDLLPLGMNFAREAFFRAAMQGLAIPWDGAGSATVRSVPLHSLAPAAPVRTLTLPQEDSAFAPAEAPTPHAPATTATTTASAPDMSPPDEVADLVGSLSHPGYLSE
jgi:hypothetical protein